MFDRQEVYETYATNQLWGLRLATREEDIVPHSTFYVAKINRFGQLMRRPSCLRFGMDPLCDGTEGQRQIHAYYLDHQDDPHRVPTIPLSEFIGEAQRSSCLFLVPLEGATNEQIWANLDGYFGFEPLVGYDLSRGLAEEPPPMGIVFSDEHIC
ncbi:MAG: hypothetical protein COU32_02575 [Candidatus Magasanikbacteria bacterium CG10_big_fil_rev_8_21_14_0_10_42_10]|uniref:Uncharacterized protein n=2 Tax=Candidatus Magasanikiibacteriota TaxID=1752731 RepID=A0A2H0TW32_9BACT|nr:MAG: hypothetical protein COU32_02575 [Candidatus Magasanikbacteria bacterium CG10_big_fil_rev_8_21_14_0_10_42_10]PIZ93476.1 MAG: hypothetical protein COX82_02580 [Candidatus Magasanikbacteria bacterium CG_4_10_14_0_2_um_filter_41_10]